MTQEHTLQQAMDEALREAPYQVIGDLIAQKLETQGVRLSVRKRARLVQELRSGTADKFHLRCWQWWERDVAVEITDEDFERFRRDFTHFLQDGLPDLINETAEDVAGDVLHVLRRRWPSELRRQDKEIRKFRNNLDRDWGNAIQLLRLLVTLSRELGDVMTTSLLEEGDESRQHLVAVQTRLHARACQVSEEIICLLVAGLADGAIARWRTLHEIAVVGLVLSEHGVPLAEKYIDHDAVESWKAAQEYERHCKALGCEAMAGSELKELEENYRSVTGRYGLAFKSPYGWAADLVEKSRPTFADIERAANIDHLRAYYRLASHQIHSNPKGTFFKLGLMDEVDILLSGPSNLGLADPGQNAAISLCQISASLVMTAPTLDGIVALKMLLALSREVSNEFLSVHSRFENAG